MDIITLEWKKFKIDLISLESYLRNKYPTYAGNSSHTKLELIFSEKLTDVERKDINTFYNNLKEKDELAKLNLGSRKPFDVKFKKLNEMTLAMTNKPKSKYTQIERKIELGLELDNNDWDKVL